MARIAGVDLPGKKRIDIALRSIYGVGPAVAKKIVDEARLNPLMKADDLDPNQVNEIRKVLDNLTVEGDLRREIALTSTPRRLELLPRLASSQELAGSRSTHEDQRSYA